MVIGEFKRMTMIKGMILITALTVMPGLWAIIGHLDDKLFKAMYDGFSDTSKFNMLLLDVATSIFQIAIVFVVFFLISEAGGANAGGAVRHAQADAKGVSNSAGSPVGSGVGKAAGKGLSQVNKVGKGVMGGINRVRGK